MNYGPMNLLRLSRRAAVGARLVRWARAVLTGWLLLLAVAGLAQVAPTITSQPVSYTAVAGRTAFFSVTATGTGPLSYQWRKDTVNLAGATNALLLLGNVQTNQAGSYTVVVSNSTATATSSAATLTVSPAPSGAVVAWGFNGNGQTTVPAGLQGVAAIAAGGSHTVALKSDGTVVAWGYNADGQATVPAGLSGVTAIAAGGYHTVALRSDGTVVAWGRNAFGQATGPSGLTNVTAVAAGESHTVALKNDGMVVAWGRSDDGQTTVPAALQGVTAIAAGGAHTVALKNDGTVVAWGISFDYGQTTVPAGLPGVTAIAAGGYHTVALGSFSPFIVAQPQNQAVAISSNATFTVELTGFAPFSYQWRSNGVAIASATNAALTLTNAQLAWSGAQYSVVITNAFGSITSAVAVLNVELFGTPHISASGSLTVGTNVFGDSASVTMTTAFANASLYYSKDGTAPFIGGPLTYSGAFMVTTNTTVRALAVNLDDFSSVPGEPVSITIIPTYALTLTTAGGGTVARVPSAGSYLSNSVVTVTATPDAGWTFLHWTGDTNGFTGGTAGGAGATNSITMSRARSVQAVFGTTLSTSIVGSGTVQLSPTNGPYAFGSVVRLTPKPAVGHYFSLWGNAGSGSSNPLDFTVTTPNRTVSALFTVLGAGQVNLYVDVVGNGTVTRSPALNVYTAGQTVTLTAVTPPVSRFDGWSGDSTATTNVISLVLDANKSVTASFSPVPAGTVVAWGSNAQQQRTIPAGLSGVTAVAAGGGHTVALKSDGTVVAWGQNGNGQTTVPGGLSEVTAIAAGENHTVALKGDGTVVAWGDSFFGQATVPAGLSGVTAIAVGYEHTVALKSDGTVVAWGFNSDGQTAVPVGLSNVTAIAAGGYHTLASKSDGTVVAWGYNGQGQTNVPAGLSGVAANAAGALHSVALRNDGTVAAWGFNSDGQTSIPGGLSGVSGIAASGEHTLALKHDGTVVAWGRNDIGQTTVPAGLSGVTAIAAGRYNSLAVVGDARGPVPPSFLTQPQSQTVVMGGNVTFSVAAAGSAPVSYQWRSNTVGIAGATSAAFSLANVQPSFAAGYSVVITNAYGAITSAPAVLTVDSRQDQTLTFDALPAKVSTDAPFALTAAASSLLGVTFTSSNPGVATVSGNTVTLVGTGTATLTASQGGDLAFRPASSVSRLLTVTAPANPPPVVTLTSPAHRQSFLPNVVLTLAATATDADGVSTVKFYANGQLVGEDASAPHTLVWTPPGAGLYALQATALDTLGGLGVTAETQVRVQSAPPLVSLTSPTNLSVFVLPTNVTLTASAFDPDGFDNLVARVDFLTGTNVIGTVTNPAGTTVSFIWTNPPPGQHELRVRATDAVDFVEESSPKAVTVNYPAGTVPTFSFALAEYRISEAAGSVVLTVLKNQSPGGTVAFTTRDGTARAAAGVNPGDYIAQPGSLDFNETDAQKSITVQLVNDLGFEGDQSFTVELSAVGNVIVTNPAVATVVILDDDPAPTTNSVNALPPTNSLPAANALGALQVSALTTNLPVIGTTNVGQWRLLWDPVWHNHADVLGQLQPGSYEVVFQPRDGFVTPSNLVAQVSAGPALSVTGLYSATTTLQTGSLRVDLTPGTAKWRLQGELAWRDAGSTAAGLVAGPYVVEFNDQTDFLRPSPKDARVFADFNSVVAFAYAAGSTAWPLAEVDTGRLGAEAPYAFNGQLFSESGHGSGTAVKRRVVLTAGHLVFNDRTLTFATNIYWFPRRYAGVFEPRPQQPRGSYYFAGYDAQRTVENTPGVSAPASQTLDAAALFFYEDAASGGQSGYLVSDATTSWLAQNNDKLLTGYPLSAPAPLAGQRKLQFSERVGVALDAVAGAPGVLFTTSLAAFRSTGGNSGGPLSVKFGGVYYPAGIFLGGTAQSVIRAIDADVVDLINRAELTANTGDNNTDGGEVNGTTPGPIPVGGGIGALTVNLGGLPAGAGWRLVPPSGVAGAFVTGANTVTQRFVVLPNLLEFAPVAGYLTPGRFSAPVLRDTTRTVGAVYAAFLSNQVPARPGPEGFRVDVSASSYGRYVVYGRSDFGVGAWVPLVTNTLGVDGRHSYTNPPGTPYRFFLTGYLTEP